MPLPLLIAIGAGLTRATVGAVQANQEKQRQKGIIGRAYKLGKQRLDLRQGDVRNRVAEGLTSRGLAQGGGVRLPTSAAAPALNTSVGGARDLGSQAMADLAREQGLESYGLEQDKTNALADTKRAYNSNLVNSIAAGVNTGVAAYGMAQEGGALSAMRAGRTPTPIVSAPAASAPHSAPASSGIGPGVQVDSPPPGWTPTRYPGSFGGIDPLNPVGRAVASTADFNKFSAANNG